MPNDPSLYARSFADVYDRWYGDLDDPEELVAAMTTTCPPPATILELGSGTGRLAKPLASAGFEVVALDASVPMLRRAAAGPRCVAADMISLPVRDQSVDVVLIAYNTFFNLTGPVQQQQCFADCARVLRPGGWLVLEAFIAAAATDGFGVSVRAHPTITQARLAIITGPDPDDSGDGAIVGSHVEIGPTVVCRPWRLRYRTAPQLDQLGKSVGLHMSARHSDWAGGDFEPDSTRHVSWYKRI